jgi:hypothetical protein
LDRQQTVDQLAELVGDDVVEGRETEALLGPPFDRLGVVAEDA